MEISLNNQVATCLVNDMSIDVEDLKNHLKSNELITHIPLLLRTIEAFVECVIKHQNSSNLVSIYDNAVKDNDYESVNEFLCTMVQSCRSFITGGLRDLYIYQHNEGWCPKLIIKNVIIPNDIDSLPDKVNIYRGCSIKELNNKNYGQAWTTSIEVAKAFAFQHYEFQSWFVLEERVILKSCIAKVNVLFSRQSHYECEIVVNTKNLLNVCEFT